MENKKVSIWIYLIPVYILVAIPLVIKLKKLYSPDIELSKERMSAFSGSGKIEKTDYKFHEPDISDIDFALNYKTQGTSVENDEAYRKPYENAYAQKEKSETKIKEKVAQKNMAQNAERPGSMTKSEISEIKQQQMMSVGFKKGFLTQAVSSLIDSPKQISALFNNSFVVKGFMSRDTVKNVLSSPQALENYLTKTNAINNFLNNSVVQSVMKNPQVISAIAGSSLGSAILNSPAVQGLLNNPDKLNSIISTNPKVAELLANPNLVSTLMNNPNTAQAFMKIQLALQK